MSATLIPMDWAFGCIRSVADGVVVGLRSIPLSIMAAPLPSLRTALRSCRAKGLDALTMAAEYDLILANYSLLDAPRTGGKVRNGRREIRCCVVIPKPFTPLI